MSFSGMEQLRKSTHCNRGHHIKCPNKNMTCGCNCHPELARLELKLKKAFANYKSHTRRFSE